VAFGSETNSTGGSIDELRALGVEPALPPQPVKTRELAATRAAAEGLGFTRRLGR